MSFLDLSGDAKEIEEEPKVKYTTGFQALDDLLMGGWGCGKPYVLYGQPQAGKTWICYQTAINMAMRGKNVLYVDTESFWEEEVEKMHWNFFLNRYKSQGINEDARKRIFFMQPIDIYEMAKIFGMDILLLQREKSVETIMKYPKREAAQVVDETGRKRPQPPQSSEQWRDWYDRSVVWQTMVERKIDMLILDSLTAPIKAVIPSVEQNFARGRSPAQQPFMSFLRMAARRLNIPTIFTAHGVKRGADSDAGKAWGGNDVDFYVKRQIGVLPVTFEQWNMFFKKMKPIDMCRGLWRNRYPGYKNTMNFCILEKDVGFIDIPNPTRGPG